jgi:hypothetical protein
MNLCPNCTGSLVYHKPECKYYREEFSVKAPKFTAEQINWICYQIGDWYLMMKPLLEGTHNLGHMKERLKTMICPEGCEE